MGAQDTQAAAAWRTAPLRHDIVQAGDVTFSGRRDPTRFVL